MRVTNTRRLPQDAQVIRRRRNCECGATFQTEERPRLWIRDGDNLHPFLRGALLAALRTAAENVEPPVPDESLQHVVHRVVASMLAQDELEPTRQMVWERTGAILLEEGLDSVAHRYNLSLDPGAFFVSKHGSRRAEPFDRDKLKRSILAASSKFLSVDDVTGIAEQVEDGIGGSSTAIDTTRLRLMVSAALRAHDERAFLRYALGARHSDDSLEEFLEKIAPTAQVRKRDGSVVLFDGAKLGKSIRRSFVADRRDDEDQSIAAFVEAEQGRVRRKMAAEKEPEMTANIGKRVLVWLYSRDELAWANYWLAFERDEGAATNPVRQLLEAQERMRALATRARSSD